MTRTSKAALVAAAVTAFAPSAALAASAPKTGAYSGTTSQTLSTGPAPMSFTVGSHGKRIGNGRIGYTAPCQQRPGLAVNGTLTVKSTVRKHGKFASTGGFTTDLHDGTTGQVVADLSGRFTSSSAAKGTFVVDVLVYDANHNQVDTCRSGTVSFKLKHS